MPATRYALYFAPAPGSALWQFGSAVLGYDAYSGLAVDPFVPQSMEPEMWRDFTAEPRRYGFHATLKAPFRLADGTDELGLLAAVERFAGSVSPFESPLRVSRIGSFVALVSDAAGIVALERAVVTHFEPYRAPLNEAEIARRQRAPLTARQQALLDAYGYPYVLDEFRFHMSLSGSLPSEAIGNVVAALGKELSARGVAATSVDRLAVFREEDGQFRILRTFPFSRAR